MKKAFQIVCVAAVVAALGSAASAVEIVTVPVGNPGNAGEWSGESYGGEGPDLICGAVAAVYNIGKYEVTAGQYRDFLNAVDPTGANADGLYNANMDSNQYGCQITWNSGSDAYDFSGGTVEVPDSTAADWQDRPVNYVSFWDACRFANWLHNGQDSGDTETGAYTLTTTGIANNTVIRNAGATWVVTSEDEWYKAAYHDKNAGLAATYFDYPTSTNTVPSNDLVDPYPENIATFRVSTSDYTIGSPYWRTEVGEHENSVSPYGTFDQGGNIWEWNEAIIGSYRGVRGGSFLDIDDYLHASNRNGYDDPTGEGLSIGFRVASVPEPATMAILVLGGIGILRRRKQ